MGAEAEWTGRVRGRRPRRFRREPQAGAKPLGVSASSSPSASSHRQRSDHDVFGENSEGALKAFVEKLEQKCPAFLVAVGLECASGRALCAR